MAKLYIANLNRQPHELMYRIPAEHGFARRVQIQRIEPGTQQMIHAEAPLPVLQAIVEQHEQYGLIPAIEVVKTKEFVGLCYQFDVPIDFDKLQYGHDHNLGVLFERGVEQRKEAAVAFDMGLSDQIEEARLRGHLRGTAQLRAVGVEMLEDSENPTFGEGVRVDHTAAAPPDGGRRRT